MALHPFKTYRTPARMCPKCGHLLDAATNPARKPLPPAAGSFSVCIECAAILRFQKDLTLEAAPADDLAAFGKTNPEQLQLLRRMQVQFLGLSLRHPRLAERRRTGRV